MKKVSNFKRILVAVDFTDASKMTLHAGLSLANRYGAWLYLFHAIDVKKEAAGFYIPHISYEKLNREAKEIALDMLEALAAKELKGFSRRKCLTAEGEPYKAIVEFARKLDIDLIVMASFSRARTERFFFGSTAERVLRKTPCPVMVIPPS